MPGDVQRHRRRRAAAAPAARNGAQGRRIGQNGLLRKDARSEAHEERVRAKDGRWRGADAPLGLVAPRKEDAEEDEAGQPRQQAAYGSEQERTAIQRRRRP